VGCGAIQLKGALWLRRKFELKEVRYWILLTFQVLIAETMKSIQRVLRNKIVKKSSVFWDVTIRSALKVSQRFGGTCHLHFQGQRVKQVRNLYEAGSMHVPLKCQLTYNRLHGALSQMIELFITVAVTTSNPLYFNKLWEHNKTRIYKLI
jgi:hypothetical protein